MIRSFVLGILGLIVAVGVNLAIAPPGLAQDAGERLDHIRKRKTLIVGVKADYPPWGFYDDTGQIIGLEPELARLIADEIGVGLSLRAVTAGNRLPLLEEGAIDIVIATMGDTVERREMSDLLQPHYYASGVRMLLHKDSPFTDWAQMRGRTVCLNQGAYFNRRLIENHLISPLIFTGFRDSIDAIRTGRCVGWGMDDTILAQKVKDPQWADYKLALPTIDRTPWSIAVRKGESDAALGRLVSDLIAGWHRDGVLLQLQDQWIEQPLAFLEEMNVLWSETDAEGYVCRRQDDGAFPDDCLSDDIARGVAELIGLPNWAKILSNFGGVDPRPFFDEFSRKRLWQGLLITVGVTLTAILGSLMVGVIFALVIASTRHGSLLVRPIAWGVRGLATVAQMVPPLLQLYILFFGLGTLIKAAYGIEVGAFTVAVVVFSIYAGASIAALISSELEVLHNERPDALPRQLMPAALAGAYEGVLAICVNTVKAAGMASAIALFDMITAVNVLVSEGADKATMMNFLLLFYLLFVLAVMAFLRLFKPGDAQ